MFCSSISTALRGSPAMIQEEPLELDSALMGYGQFKLVGEKMISLARQAGSRTYSLRIGQVSGHSMKGLWNDSEAIPLIIRSALTLRALPDLHQDCSWLPVDKLASVVLELAESCSAPDRDVGQNRASSSSGVAYVDDSIYNMYNPRAFPWSELLATLKRSGFQFQTLPFVDWLQSLRESEARGEENVNPAVKLIDHFEEMYGDESLTRQKWTREFATAKAERDSVTLRNGLSIVENRILDRYARDWFMRWTNLWSG